MSNPMIHFSVSAQPRSYDSDVDGKVLPVRSEVAFSRPAGQRDESGALSDQGQSPMSEGSYQEEPSPVPEPTLPEDFVKEEEEYRDLEARDFELKAEIGDEDFVDRREETVAVVSQTLSREETPEREVGFKVTLRDYLPSAAPPEKAEDRGLPVEATEEGTAI